MAKGSHANRRSVFAETGLKAAVDALCHRIRRLYQEDAIPWVVGYSGGKDSTAVLQLVWMALSEMPGGELTKPVHVISTDTLVENPVVATWVASSLDVMGEAAREQGLPIQPHRLTPQISDTFWVNLIGRGYPAPRPKFRWCTERLKINPSNRFIADMVRQSGETILVLGTRKAESSIRSSKMTQREAERVRDDLSPNAKLPNSLVYTPIEDWSNDDVWLFLMQFKNPWGYRNKELLTMYQGASADGECPLVIDTTTQSCGDSRFGCWTCTLVDKDRSMAAMIHNDEEKEWMLPLLQLRDELDLKDDRKLRDFRRLAGHVQLFHDQPIHGPYTQESRERWLHKLLTAQLWIRENGPEDVQHIELITLAELEEIARIWVADKHEIENSVPRIYQEVMGEPFPGRAPENNLGVGAEELDLLREICAEDVLHYELVRNLLAVAGHYRTAARRVGYFKELERVVRCSGFDDREEAIQVARAKSEAKKAAQDANVHQLSRVLDVLNEDAIAHPNGEQADPRR